MEQRFNRPFYREVASIAVSCVATLGLMACGSPDSGNNYDPNIDPSASIIVTPTVVVE